MVVSYVIAAFCVFVSVRYFLRKLTISGLTDKYVLITGCDTGFGNLLAKRLDGMGMNVVAGCLTEKGIQELTSACTEKLKAIKLDVTQESNVQDAAKTVKQLLPRDTGLWALVSNAGIGGPNGMVDYITTADFEKTLDVNFYGTVRLVPRFLPLLRKSKGRIVIITSMAGRLAVPSALPYTASKYALEGYGDSIRKQLFSSGISVHLIEPGPHATPIMNKDTTIANGNAVFAKASDDVKAFYGAGYPEKLVTELFKTLEPMVESPDVVVDAYVHAITAKYPKPRYITGKVANLLLWPCTMLPEFVWDSVSLLPLPAALLTKQ